MAEDLPAPAPRWNWEDPTEFARRRASADAEHSRCDRLDRVTTALPLTRTTLRDLGVDGVEFGTRRARHPNGVGADLITLHASGISTEPHHLYLVDGDRLFVELDIAEALPFDTDSVDWVHAEHLIEHVSLSTAIAWLTEVKRIIAPGGVVRLTTPDLHRYVDAYLGDGTFFAEHRERVHAVMHGADPMPERPAFMVNQIFYLYGHRWIYDADELRHALSEAGFDPSQVRVRAFADGHRPDVAALDRAWRNDETIYVEASV